MTHGLRTGMLAAALGLAAGCQGTGKKIEPTSPIKPWNPDNSAAATKPGVRPAAQTRTPATGQPTGFARDAVDTAPPSISSIGGVAAPVRPTTGGNLTPTPRVEPIAPVGGMDPLPTFNTPPAQEPAAPGVLPPAPPMAPGGSASISPPTAGPAMPVVIPSMTDPNPR